MRVLFTDEYLHRGNECDVTVYRDDYGNIKVNVSLRIEESTGTIITIPSSHISDIKVEKGSTSLGDLIDLAIRGGMQVTNDMIDNLITKGLLNDKTD